MTTAQEKTNPMSATAQESVKMSNNPFSKHEVSEDNRAFYYYGKAGATWEQMDAYLEALWGKNGKDKHWKWRGFGEVGTESFKVVVLRQACSEWVCDCEPCEKCGVADCCLEEDDDGERVCDECLNGEEEDESEEE